MTTTDALNLIDQVCARFTGTREDHANLIEAIATLRKAVTEPESEEAITPVFDSTSVIQQDNLT